MANVMSVLYVERYHAPKSPFTIAGNDFSISHMMFLPIVYNYYTPSRQPEETFLDSLLLALCIYRPASQHLSQTLSLYPTLIRPQIALTNKSYFEHNQSISSRERCK